MPFCEIIASSVPLNIDWQQILLHLLNFVILAVGLTLLIYRPVKKFLDKRKKSFEDREKNISESKREAEDMKTEYEKKLGDADLEIQLRSAAAKNKAEEDARRTVYKADAEASAILGRARSGAEAQKRKLLRSAGRDITDMVVGATEKLLAASQSEKTDLALYDKFVSDKTAYIGRRRTCPTTNAKPLSPLKRRTRKRRKYSAPREAKPLRKRKNCSKKQKKGSSTRRRGDGKDARRYFGDFGQRDIR